MKRLFVILLVAGAAWQFWPRQPAVAVADAAPPEIRLSAPPEREAPRQRDVSATRAFRVGDYAVRPLAEFALAARVLSAERYRTGRESDLSQLDLALGWGRMADPAVYERLSISQSGRWYHWRYENEPPIPRREIETSSANMHLIAATPEVARALARAERGRTISLKGYLVEARAGDGWSWRSSLSREDGGSGSCELIYVQWVEVR